MFNSFNVPIVGVVENMSYLQCPHCNEQIHLLERGGKKISEDFGIPFIGEVPLHPSIREGSESRQADCSLRARVGAGTVFTKAAKLIAGRISILAAEMRAQEQSESQSTEQAKEE